ncbi:MAG TPA: hypothetical protein VFH94_06235 [Streptomyces sp.]|nr:hypothetical protein [Streptomyces sp.]
MYGDARRAVRLGLWAWVTEDHLPSARVCAEVVPCTERAPG